MNTTDTCATIEDLKPATQYTVYVTATNDYGSSLPSVKATASTGDSKCFGFGFTGSSFLSWAQACIVALNFPICSNFSSTVPFSNATLPNIRECCAKRHVDADCISKMCDVSRPPSAVGAFDIALTCRNEFPQVAPCLAGNWFVNYFVYEKAQSWCFFFRWTRSHGMLSRQRCGRRMLEAVRWECVVFGRQQRLVPEFGHEFDP